jgi:hypothetical protein
MRLDQESSLSRPLQAKILNKILIFLVFRTFTPFFMISKKHHPTGDQSQLYSHPARHKEEKLKGLTRTSLG